MPLVKGYKANIIATGKHLIETAKANLKAAQQHWTACKMDTDLDEVLKIEETILAHKEKVKSLEAELTKMGPFYGLLNKDLAPLVTDDRGGERSGETGTDDWMQDSRRRMEALQQPIKRWLSRRP